MSKMLSQATGGQRADGLWTTALSGWPHSQDPEGTWPPGQAAKFRPGQPILKKLLNDTVGGFAPSGLFQLLFTSL